MDLKVHRLTWVTCRSPWSLHSLKSNCQVDLQIPPDNAWLSIMSVDSFTVSDFLTITISFMFDNTFTKHHSLFTKALQYRDIGLVIHEHYSKNFNYRATKVMVKFLYWLRTMRVILICLWKNIFPDTIFWEFQCFLSWCPDGPQYLTLLTRLVVPRPNTHS